jgi:hypothetical protein
MMTTQGHYCQEFIVKCAPIFIQGFNSIYKNTIKKCSKKKFLLKEFQEALESVPLWNTKIIENEYSRFKFASNCSWLEDLIKVAFIELTEMISNGNAKYVELNIPKGDVFVHKCYINIAREIWRKPQLFYHDYSTIEKKCNEEEIHSIVERVIGETIRNELPLQNIVDTYLHKSEEKRESVEVVHKGGSYDNFTKVNIDDDNEDVELVVDAEDDEEDDVEDTNDDDVVEDTNKETNEDTNDDVVEDTNYDDDNVEDTNYDDDNVEDTNYDDDNVEDTNEDDVVEDTNEDTNEETNEETNDDTNDDDVVEDTNEETNEDTNDDVVEDTNYDDVVEDTNDVVAVVDKDTNDVVAVVDKDTNDFVDVVDDKDTNDVVVVEDTNDDVVSVSKDETNYIEVDINAVENDVKDDSSIKVIDTDNTTPPKMESLEYLPIVHHEVKVIDTDNEEKQDDDFKLNEIVTTDDENEDFDIDLLANDDIIVDDNIITDDNNDDRKHAKSLDKIRDILGSELSFSEFKKKKELMRTSI